MTNMDRRPKRDEINTWLSTTYPDIPDLRVKAWSTFFDGLAWKHLRPLSKIAVNTHIDSVDKLAAIVKTAADLSGDREFKAAAERHLARRASSEEPAA
jgi:hypothetical protein